MNLYNVLITYSGEGAFKFYLAGVGEVEITPWKPIFLYNASVKVINDLRMLKRSLVNIKINGSPEGAFKIFDLKSDKNSINRNVDKNSQSLDEVKESLREELREEIKAEVAKEMSENTPVPEETSVKTTKSKKTKVKK